MQIAYGYAVPVPAFQQALRVLGFPMVRGVAFLRRPVVLWQASCPVNVRCCIGRQLWKAVCYSLCSASAFLVDPP